MKPIVPGAPSSCLAVLQEAPRVGFRSAADVRETNSIKRPLIPVASRASASEDSRRGEKVSLASSCRRRNRSQSEIIYVPTATPAMLLRLRLTKNTSAREEMSSHLKVLTVYQHRGNFILTIMSRRFHEVFEMFCKFIQNVRREYLTIFLIMNRTQQPS